jgi:broad specificity phosphatase PhoE
MTKFCLIRHGQTDWNLEGRYQGQSDVSLNETGRLQAFEIARQLQPQTFTAIYTSDLQRAQETAEIIASALKLPYKIDIRLREINQGEWEGQQVEVIKARYADLWNQRSIDPASVRPPGGETVGEVAKRAFEVMDDLAYRYPGRSVLIVSHGLTLATILCKVRHISVGHAYQVIPVNAEIIWIEWEV